MIHYMMYSAGITACINLLAAVFVREVEMTKEHRRECSETDGKILMMYFAVLFLYILYTYVGVYVFESEGTAFFACLIFMAINFGLVIPAVLLQIANFDNENQPLPRGDDLNFPTLLKQPKFWLTCLAGFGVIGVCYSMNDYAAFEDLEGTEEGKSKQIFWLADILGRAIGGLITYWLVKWVNEYIWSVVYSGLAFVGTALVFMMTMTESAAPQEQMVWVAAGVLGFASGGMWQIGAQIILDDSGTVHFGSKWGMGLFCNFAGIFSGALFLNAYEMSETTAIYFMAITVFGIVGSIFALTFDYCFPPSDDKKPINRNNKPS